MLIIDTITRNKVFGILWPYIAKLLKSYPCQKQRTLKSFGAETSKYEVKMVQA